MNALFLVQLARLTETALEKEGPSSITNKVATSGSAKKARLSLPSKGPTSLNPYCNRIKRQERNYFRQLKC